MRVLPITLIGGLLVISVMGKSLWAQQSAQPTVDPAILKQLDRLDGPKYRTRQAATRHLLQNQTLSPAQLRALFKKADSPEQRHRLMTVARHQTVRRMIEREFAGDKGGALGIAHRAQRPGEDEGKDGKIGGIRVTRVLPGFPAYAYLQPGDLIVKVDAKPLPPDIDGAKFVQMIQGRGNGQEVSMEIRRRGEQSRVQFALGSAKALRTVYSGSMVGLSFRYARRWHQAKIRYEALMPSPTVLKPR